MIKDDEMFSEQMISSYVGYKSYAKLNIKPENEVNSTDLTLYYFYNKSFTIPHFNHTLGDFEAIGADFKPEYQILTKDMRGALRKHRTKDFTIPFYSLNHQNQIVKDYTSADFISAKGLRPVKAIYFPRLSAKYNDPMRIGLDAKICWNKPLLVDDSLVKLIFPDSFTKQQLKRIIAYLQSNLVSLLMTIPFLIVTDDRRVLHNIPIGKEVYNNQIFDVKSMNFSEDDKLINLYVNKYIFHLNNDDIKMLNLELESTGGVNYDKLAKSSSPRADFDHYAKYTAQDKNEKIGAFGY